MTRCAACNRGGNGNDKDKCACGWTIRDASNQSGCYIGTPIVGEIKPVPKLSRSKARYRKYLESDCDMPFGDWLKAYA